MKNGWKTLRLADISTKITDGSHNPPKGVEKSDYLMLSSKNVFDDDFHYEKPRYLTKENFHLEDKRTSISPGDVLLTIVGTIGRSAVVPKNSPHITLQRSVAVIKPKRDIVKSRFLMYALINQNSELNDQARGVAQRGIYLETLRDFNVAVPSVSEQQRIVDILDEAFEGIAIAKANTGRNLQNARGLFEAYLKNIFANHAKDWEEKQLGDLGKVSMCKRVFKDQTTAAGDIPFYKIGTFGKEPDAYISNKIYDEYRKKFAFPKKGAVLISASGTIGRRVKYDGEPAYFQDSNIVWIDNDEKQVLNDYLYHFYGSCNWGATKGATISRLYNDNLKQIKIVFPKSLAEQRAIVSKIDTLFVETKNLEGAYQRKLTNLEELKKSLLHQAFTGQLTKDKVAA